ncbi:MAG: hypothetical protein K6F08_00415 [bacterium]|nr:hypothetical protein [bacterium]
MSVLIVTIFGTEVFAAVIMNFTLTGTVQYYATEISADIWATKAYNPLGVQGNSSYLTITGGSGGTFSDGIYSITGAATSYDNILANAGTALFSDPTDELEMYVFIKNNGDRNILPGITVDCSEEENVDINFSYYYFDVSVSGQINPYTTKSSSASATAFISTIETEITNNNYSAWQLNSSIDYSDVLCIRILVTIGSAATGDVNSTFSIHIGFMADVQYTSNNILSVYQTLNSSDPAWTKYGYNAMLTATATKVEDNSLSNLYTYLRDADSDGNANITFGQDDYAAFAPVYKDIDIVNVDIATGEIIGKLSDLDYEFEWFGREITLEEGTELASGRVLTADETFEVDVYTYYPTMYVRRWVVGDRQWLSVSDEEFVGSVEVPEFYTATFESTIFNPDYSVATNSYGIIARSYVTERCPVSGESVAYMQSHYNYGTYTGSTASATQDFFLQLTSNLTQAWANSGLASQYRTVAGAQGENWVSFIPNLLYIIKYGNNNLQSLVGKGNVETYDAYKNKKIRDYNGTQVSVGSAANAYIESTIGSGSIGVRNSGQANTATYDSANHYKMSDTGYNAGGINYGYNSLYTNENDKQGLYTHQFLTYSNGERRYLLDGYVGSDGYTSVFCLGQCNPWGNIWKWIFGVAVLYDGSNVNAYVNFDNYDYSSPTTSWQTANATTGYVANNNELLNTRNYSKLSYYLFKSNNYARYLGTSLISNNPLEMLVGIHTKASSTGTEISGLCDYFYYGTATNQIYGLAKGGAVNNTVRAGPFYLSCDQNLANSQPRFTFRMMLVLSSS